MVGELNRNVTGAGGNGTLADSIAEQWDHWNTTGKIGKNALLAPLPATLIRSTGELVRDTEDSLNAFSKELEQTLLQGTILLDFLFGLESGRIPREVKIVPNNT